jgi:hypothetical protein
MMHESWPSKKWATKLARAVFATRARRLHACATHCQQVEKPINHPPCTLANLGKGCGVCAVKSEGWMDVWVWLGRHHYISARLITPAKAAANAAPYKTTLAQFATSTCQIAGRTRLFANKSASHPSLYRAKWRPFIFISDLDELYSACICLTSAFVCVEIQLVILTDGKAQLKYRYICCAK